MRNLVEFVVGTLLVVTAAVLPSRAEAAHEERLFPTDLPAAEWVEFQAAGYQKPVTGVIYRDGSIVGHVTSGAYGHTLGGSIGLGYVHLEDGEDPDAAVDGHYEIEVAGQRYAAQVSLRPMYDPDNSRIRC